MEQTTTTRVVQVLDNLKKINVEYLNWTWIRRNAGKLNLSVCVENCRADIFDIVKNWDEDGTIVIQEGKPVKYKADFYPTKEALLVLSDGLVFLYLPK